MSNRSETGHIMNVANFNVLVSKVKAYGVVYNPSRQVLSAVSLGLLAANAETAVAQVNTLQGQLAIALAARKDAFSPLNKLGTRIYNALKASGVTKQIDESAKSLVRKIQGRRATPRKTSDQIATLAAQGTTVTEISSSQMSFDNRANSFDKLIQLLSATPQYSPNEEDLKISTLISYFNLLKTSNAAAVDAETALNNARILRNEVLYKEVWGLVDTAGAVKLYLKSLFGAASQQYKQVASLRFRVRQADVVSATSNAVHIPENVTR